MKLKINDLKETVWIPFLALTLTAISPILVHNTIIDLGVLVCAVAISIGWFVMFGPAIILRRGE